MIQNSHLAQSNYVQQQQQQALQSQYLQQSQQQQHMFQSNLLQPQQQQNINGKKESQFFGNSAYVQSGIPVNKQKSVFVNKNINSGQNQISRSQSPVLLYPQQQMVQSQVGSNNMQQSNFAQNRSQVSSLSPGNNLNRQQPNSNGMQLLQGHIQQQISSNSALSPNMIQKSQIQNGIGREIKSWDSKKEIKDLLKKLKQNKKKQLNQNYQNVMNLNQTLKFCQINIEKMNSTGINFGGLSQNSNMINGNAVDSLKEIVSESSMVRKLEKGKMSKLEQELLADISIDEQSENDLDVQKLRNIQLKQNAQKTLLRIFKYNVIQNQELAKVDNIKIAQNSQKFKHYDSDQTISQIYPVQGAQNVNTNNNSEFLSYKNSILHQKMLDDIQHHTNSKQQQQNTNLKEPNVAAGKYNKSQQQQQQIQQFQKQNFESGKQFIEQYEESHMKHQQQFDQQKVIKSVGGGPNNNIVGGRKSREQGFQEIEFVDEDDEKLRQLAKMLEEQQKKVSEKKEKKKQQQHIQIESDFEEEDDQSQEEDVRIDTMEGQKQKQKQLSLNERIRQKLLFDTQKKEKKQNIKNIEKKDFQKQDVNDKLKQNEKSNKKQEQQQSDEKKQVYEQEEQQNAQQCKFQDEQEIKSSQKEKDQIGDDQDISQQEKQIKQNNEFTPQNYQVQENGFNSGAQNGYKEQQQQHQQNFPNFRMEEDNFYNEDPQEVQYYSQQQQQQYQQEYQQPPQIQISNLSYDQQQQYQNSNSYLYQNQNQNQSYSHQYQPNFYSQQPTQYPDEVNSPQQFRLDLQNFKQINQSNSQNTYGNSTPRGYRDYSPRNYQQIQQYQNKQNFSPYNQNSNNRPYGKMQRSYSQLNYSENNIQRQRIKQQHQIYNNNNKLILYKQDKGKKSPKPKVNTQKILQNNGKNSNQRQRTLSHNQMKSKSPQGNYYIDDFPANHISGIQTDRHSRVNLPEYVDNQYENNLYKDYKEYQEDLTQIVSTTQDFYKEVKQTRTTRSKSWNKQKNKILKNDPQVKYKVPTQYKKIKSFYAGDNLNKYLNPSDMEFGNNKKWVQSKTPDVKHQDASKRNFWDKTPKTRVKNYIDFTQKTEKREKSKNIKQVKTLIKAENIHQNMNQNEENQQKTSEKSEILVKLEQLKEQQNGVSMSQNQTLGTMIGNIQGRDGMDIKSRYVIQGINQGNSVHYIDKNNNKYSQHLAFKQQLKDEEIMRQQKIQQMEEFRKQQLLQKQKEEEEKKNQEEQQEQQQEQIINLYSHKNIQVRNQEQSQQLSIHSQEQQQSQQHNSQQISQQFKNKSLQTSENLIKSHKQSILSPQQDQAKKQFDNAQLQKKQESYFSIKEEDEQPQIKSIEPDDIPLFLEKQELSDNEDEEKQLSSGNFNDVYNRKVNRQLENTTVQKSQLKEPPFNNNNFQQNQNGQVQSIYIGNQSHYTNNSQVDYGEQPKSKRDQILQALESYNVGHNEELKQQVAQMKQKREQLLKNLKK